MDGWEWFFVAGRKTQTSKEEHVNIDNKPYFCFKCGFLDCDEVKNNKKCNYCGLDVLNSKR